MSRVLAIDWDRHEARAVLIDKAVTGLRSAQLFAVPIEGKSEAGEIGSKLATVLDQASHSKFQTVVTLGRDHVLLKPFQLPPAPETELPHMVRFQAEREIVSLTADSDLDYLPISGGEQTPHRILAATLDHRDRKAVDAVCGALHTTPLHITLRACAAASLLERMEGFNSGSPALLVCTYADHAELVVVAKGLVVMVRTVRLPATGDQPTSVHEAETIAESELLRPPSEASLQGLIAVGLSPREASLTSQIRRTLGAASQQLDGQNVERVILAAGEAYNQLQLRLMAEQLGVTCEAFDPLTVAAASVEIDRHAGGTTVDAARFAGALGAALDAAEGHAPLIDFLHPRRPAEKRKVERVHILAGAAAAVLLAVGGWYLYEQWASPVREIARLQTEIDGIQQVVDKYEDVRAQAASVEAWLATDVNWLDELERTSRGIRPEPLDSEDFPQNEDAVLTNLNLVGSSGFDAKGGRILIYGNGRSKEVVSTMEARLRDQRHRVTGEAMGSNVSGRTTTSSDAVEGYPTSFDLYVEVLPSDGEEVLEP